MPEPTTMMQEFAWLASEAEAGNLFIESGVAERCAKACDDFAAKLQDRLQYTGRLVNTAAFGDLHSAQVLAEKFHTLADGGRGTGSLRDVLLQNIEVVQNMGDMFRTAGAAFDATDEANKQAIRQKMRQIDH